MNLTNNFYKFNPLRRQKGASVFAIIILLVMVGMFLLSALKVAPSYMDNNVIVNAMDGMINNNDFESMSIAEVRSNLQRSLVTNNIREFDSSSVVLTREGNNNFVDINYESRVPLFYNIDIVVTFENRFDKN
ncbi:DUF4845 domain-containing protein [Gammaproteobacteria bacterium]|nr:DUF4845 domain-containing protein [Gammaproteobacteria bacterium]